MASDRRQARERAAKKVQGDRKKAPCAPAVLPSTDDAPEEPPAKLTAKQAQFVKEYLVDLNAAQAAHRAGYSPKTAKQTGSENLAKPAIAKAIAEALEARSKRVEFTADDVLRKLASIANEEHDDALAKDRIKCLELLGKNLGMFNKLVLAGDPDKPIVTQVVRRIVRAPGN